ncbi:MAG: DUF2339 domain-containing protein [Calditrichaceae bacterium]
MEQPKGRTPGLAGIKKQLDRLEERITKIESYLAITPTEAEVLESEKVILARTEEESDNLEFQIGQFWFAKIGIIVLALGIVFLLTFPYQNLPAILPSIAGYLIVVGFFGFSHYTRKSLPFISQYFLGGALVLLYFSTLRLFFFTEQPGINNETIVLALLLAVVAIVLITSTKRDSVFLTGLGLALGYVTAIVSDEPYQIFTILVLMSAIAVYYKIRHHRQSIYLLGIFLTYLTHFIWFINNPFMGNKIQLVDSPVINVLFILLYAIIFASGNIFRSKEEKEDDRLILSTFLNCLGGYTLFLLITMAGIKLNLPEYHLVATLVFLSLGVVFWLREESKYSTFLYSILGFAAMSTAIISQFDKPAYFLWLSWQSLVVVVAAIWFRSRIIIIANFIIYLLIFLGYVLNADEVIAISLSFGVVALLSARVMNWQRHRLEIKTERMRITYLGAAFIIFPYALYHAVPTGFVSLSWVLVAIFYYIMSLILNNRKYRWMAVMTLALTIMYVFIIGIVKLEPVYRIVSFIVLGLVLIAISIIYTRIRARGEPGKLKTS